jgi:ankyrin repeat protein
MTQQEAAIHYIQAAEELESEDGGEAEEEALGAPVQSRPAVENGGYKDHGNTPEAALLAAAGDCNVSKIKELLLSGVNVQHADETGQTAMHLAADKGSIESLTVLLENGGDIHAVDQDGISVLQTAVIADNAKVCRFLLQHGADADQQDGDGDTPRSCALEDGSSELRELFAY